MSAKRKAGGNGNGPNKRRPKKKESDYEDEVSDESEDENAQSSSNQVEVLIPNDDLDPPSKLPDDLLASMEKTPGKMLISGMVTWDLTGKRDRKNVVKVRPNLYTFHRFTDEKVSEDLYYLNDNNIWIRIVIDIDLDFRTSLDVAQEILFLLKNVPYVFN